MQSREKLLGSSLTLDRTLSRSLQFTGRRTLLIAVFLFLLSGIILANDPMANAQSPLTYYVDCAAGNDANAGTATTTAWKSITKANKALLKPGDKLLFKRDCAWQGTLTTAWNGSATLPIVIGVYGTGNLPKIQDSYSSNVQIMGSYQIIEYIETPLTTPLLLTQVVTTSRSGGSWVLPLATPLLTTLCDFQKQASWQLASDQDNGSGIAEMQISLDGAFNVPDWQHFAPSVLMDVAPDLPISVRIRDGSGNISPVATVAIQGEVKPTSGLFLPQITR